MNRRGFLSSLFKGAITAATAPQIVTHGLKLKNGLWQREQLLIEIEAYNSLPFYLAKISARQFPNFKVWESFYDKLSWAPDLARNQTFLPSIN
jgi:hypothetical protein